MADNINEEQLKLAAELRKTTAAFKAANKGTQELEKAQKEYVSTITSLNAAVIQTRKSLSDTIKQQAQVNQKNSIINNILVNSKGEVVKSIIAARQANLRVAQKIQITEQEIEIGKQTINALIQQKNSLSKNKETLESNTAAKEKERAAIEENLTEIKNNRKSIIDEIGVRNTTVAALRDSVSNTSALRDAVDARMQALNTSNATLQEEQNSLLSVVGELNKRANSGKALSAAELLELSLMQQKQSRIMEITNSMKDNNRALDAERLKRFDLTGVLTTQESELSKLTGEITTLDGNLSDVSKEMEPVKSRLKDVTTEMKQLADQTNTLEAQEKALGDAIDQETTAVKDATGKLKLLKFEALATKLSGVASVIDKVTEPINKLVANVRELQNKFGVSAGTASKLGLENLKSSAKSFADALRTGGKSGPGVTMDQIAQAQQDFQEEFGGLITSDAATDLAKEAVKMGVSTKQLAQARRVFLTQTMGDAGKAKQQTDKFIGEFTKKGLSASVAMQEIAKNSDLLARNGTRFATQFSRAAADAKKIGVDLSKISQVGDNIINDFEGFLESQAELGAMGFGFDSNRLAQIAETGDDAALFNELRSQLASTGKDITNLRRSERLALESAFGLNIGEQLRMAGKTPEGGGEKTLDPAELQVNANESLGRVVETSAAAAKTLDVISGTLKYANSLLSIIASVSGLSSAASLATALTGTGAAAGTAAGTAGFATAGMAAATVGTAVAGLGAGLMIGDLFNTSVAEGGSGTFFGDYLNYNIGKSKEEKEADRKADEWAQSKGFKSMAEYLAAKKAKRGDDVVSQPGYGKRSLVTPSGVIALNNKDNIIAYADDFDGTKALPYGSIAKKLGMGSDTGELISTGLQKFAGKRAAPRLLDLLQGKQFFNLAKGARGIPLLGAIASGAISGFEERQAGGGLGKSILKGLFVGGGSLGGATLGGAVTGGNPFAAGFGGVAGGKLSEMAFEAMFGTAKKYHKGGIVGGKTDELPAVLQRGEAVISKLQLGGLNKIISGMNTLGSFGDKFNVGSEGVVNKLGGMFGGKAGKALTKAQELKAGGQEGLFSIAQSKFGGMFGGKAGNAMSSISNLFGAGGLKGMAGNLLGKVGLGGIGGNLLGGLAGGPMGMLGMAAPLLKKIPFVGSTLGALAGGPNKLMGKLAGSALGKIGGLFGKKKTSTTQVSPEMISSATVPNLSMMLGSQTNQQPEITVPAATVDTSGIESKLNNFINALQNIQINMDGNQVGKVLVNVSEAAMTAAPFRAQSR